MPIIEAKNLVKKYGDNVALHGVSFTFEEGSIYLMDNNSLSIGPIELNAGTCDLYFEVSGTVDYTLQFVSKNSEIIEYSITKDMIQNALNN